MDNYSYEIEDSLYINVTNKCTNKCTFCVRDTTKGIGDNTLWLEKEPSIEEILDSIKEPTKYKEFVFCGFGEPLYRPEIVTETARALKKYEKPIRINTNGLANLIHGRNIVPELEGLIDVISISLNAENSVKYEQICQPKYGNKSFSAVIEFAKNCKRHVPQVIMSVVNLPKINLGKCKQITDQLGVELKVRQWNPNL